MCWHDFNDKISLWIERESISKVYHLLFTLTHISLHYDGGELWLSYHWNVVHRDSLLLFSNRLYSVGRLRVSQAVRAWNEQRSTLARYVTSYHNAYLLLLLLELFSMLLRRVCLFGREWKIRPCARIRLLGLQSVQNNQPMSRLLQSSSAFLRTCFLQGSQKKMLW